MAHHEGISKLIAKAREDAAFFHQLVWKPEAVLASLDFLSREEKAALVATDPETLVEELATGRGSVLECDQTAHCTYTCNCSGCNTGKSVDLIRNPGDLVMQDRLVREIKDGLDAVRQFSRFHR